MKIAIDVKGTLEGPKQDIIRAVAKQLHDEGHEITIWSSMFSFASDCKNNLKVPYNCDLKRFHSEVEPEDWYDLAIDDDTQQTFLPAKRIIYVNEFNNIEELMHLIKSFSDVAVTA